MFDQKYIDAMNEEIEKDLEIEREIEREIDFLREEDLEMEILREYEEDYLEDCWDCNCNW